jgi:hypothetical protein
VVVVVLVAELLEVVLEAVVWGAELELVVLEDEPLETVLEVKSLEAVVFKDKPVEVA